MKQNVGHLYKPAYLTAPSFKSNHWIKSGTLNFDDPGLRVIFALSLKRTIVVLQHYVTRLIRSARGIISALAKCRREVGFPMLSDMRQQLSEFDDRAEKLGRRL